MGLVFQRVTKQGASFFQVQQEKQSSHSCSGSKRNQNHPGTCFEQGEDLSNARGCYTGLVTDSRHLFVQGWQHLVLPVSTCCCCYSESSQLRLRKGEHPSPLHRATLGLSLQQCLKLSVETTDPDTKASFTFHPYQNTVQ